MSTGLNLATVLGAPLGTLVGEAYGRRTSFWLLAVVALAAMAAVALLVPATRTAEPPRLGPGAAGAGDAAGAGVVTLVTETGFFVAYTHLSPILGRIFPPGGVVVLLMVFGAGALCGNLAGGRLADRWPWASLRVLIAVLAAALVLFAAIASTRAGATVGVFALGALSLLGAAGVLGGLAVSSLHRGAARHAIGLQPGRRSPATRRPTRRRAS